MTKQTHTDSVGYAAPTEEDVKYQLSGWLETFGIDVFWGKKNAYDYDVFKVRTGTKKPDLLILWKDNVVLIEVKDASKNRSNVYDAFFQILGYWDDISECHVNGKKMNVTGWLVATQFSIDGRLFNHEPIEGYESFSNGRKNAAVQGLLPFSEHVLTEMFIRLLWRREKPKRNVFIGALLSSKLNYPNSPPVPMVLGKRNGQQIFKEVRSCRG